MAERWKTMGLPEEQANIQLGWLFRPPTSALLHTCIGVFFVVDK